MLANKKLKVFFHPRGAAGHINACLGLAQALASRGHEISFFTESSFAGHFSKFGFNEILLKNHNTLIKELNENDKKVMVEAEEPTTDSEIKPKVNPLKEMSKKVAESGILSNLTPLERMKNNAKSNKVMDEVFNKIIAYNDQIKEIFELQKPDVIIVDNYIFEPIILHSNIPWILLYSCNPIGLYGSKELPPFCSGYPVDSDKESWKEFEEVLKHFFVTVFDSKQNEILRQFNYPDLKQESYIHRSPYLNVYGYPEELDYHDVVPRLANFVPIDAFCREMPEPFEFPIEFRNKIKPGDKLVYVSLGSMGSFNVKLMKKMVGILGKTQHKYIVSKGPLHDEYELADNMWGGKYVPQTSILPLVDLVITHGGNNTVTESFNFGKPMIVMPMFGDQYDNAQRIHEKGFGIRLHTHEYTEQQLVDAVDRLLNDTQLNQKLTKIAHRMQHSNSKELACIEIERMIENHHQEQLQSRNNK